MWYICSSGVSTANIDETTRSPSDFAHIVDRQAVVLGKEGGIFAGHSWSMDDLECYQV